LILGRRPRLVSGCGADVVARGVAERLGLMLTLEQYRAGAAATSGLVLAVPM
jgi:hypothetical protein